MRHARFLAALLALGLSTASFAQSDLPPSVQAKLLQKDLEAAANRQEFRRILSDIKQYRTLNVPFPPDLLVEEAVAASAMGNASEAYSALEDFLKTASQSDPEFQEAIALYPKVKAAAARQNVKRVIVEVAGQMKLVPGGRFVMGTDYCPADSSLKWFCGYADPNNRPNYRRWASPDSGPDDWHADPPHSVDVPSFYMQAQPVTVEEYSAFAESTQRDEATAIYPSGVAVKYVDAAAFVKWLSRLSGRKYRMPSEAELEYAAHGGYYPRYPWGNIAADDATDIDELPNNQPLHRPENPWGLNFSPGWDYGELTRDCWHPRYASAPQDGSGWDAISCPSGVHTVRSMEPRYGFYYRYADSTVEWGSNRGYLHVFRVVLDKMPE